MMKLMIINNRHMKSWRQFVFLNEWWCHKLKNIYVSVQLLIMKISKWEHNNFCSYCKNKSLYGNEVIVYNSSSWIFFNISNCCIPILIMTFLLKLMYLHCVVHPSVTFIQELHQKSVNWKFCIGPENSFHWIKYN